MFTIARLPAWTIFMICWSLLTTQIMADGHNPMSHPASGEVIPVGMPYNIVWSPGTPGPVWIAVLDNSGEGTGNLTASAPNNGSFLWTPHPILATYNYGKDYFVQICDVNTRDCTYTYNGRFSLVNSASASSASISSTTISSVTSPSKSASSTIADSIPVTTTPSISLSKPDPTSTNTPSSSQNGLSTTATIAIGVVLSVLGTIALLLGIFWVYRRRENKQRRQMIKAHATSIADIYGPFEKPATSDQRTYSHPGIHELDGRRY